MFQRFLIKAKSVRPSRFVYPVLTLSAAAAFSMMTPQVTEKAKEMLENTFSMPAQCADKTFKQDKLDSRGQIFQYPANHPCEDTFQMHQFQKTKGFMAGVYDGHGGWQVATHVSKHLHLYIDEALEKEKDVKKAITSAYQRIEDELLEKARAAYELGFPKAVTVGACALTAVVQKDKLFVANAGDCNAVLLRRNANGNLETVELSKSFSANELDEQARLKKQFRGEKDIVRCKSTEACYVKGSLMPTRAIGDFHLKHKEFQNPYADPEKGYRPPFEKFTGPYINHLPDIQEHTIKDEDEYLILASDGLWDELNKATTNLYITDEQKNASDVGIKLFKDAKDVILRKHRISQEYLESVYPGPNR